ncbi:hypothetical protein CLOM_g23629 [Closterium sp. NIES-68]|nr:hypothetical protein CLOM_g23629 [Closterium sp. NIES-68]GJP70754.1 hypothetical protein CLOP_g1661 [Closterium sp. NIES-67]
MLEKPRGPSAQAELAHANCSSARSGVPSGAPSGFPSGVQSRDLTIQRFPPNAEGGAGCSSRRDFPCDPGAPRDSPSRDLLLSIDVPPNAVTAFDPAFDPASNGALPSASSIPEASLAENSPSFNREASSESRNLEASNEASAPLLKKPTWLVKIRGALTPREWITVGCLSAAICGLHVIGWGTLVVFVVPGHYALGGGGGTFGVGLGVTAYTLGMRHAFDADHIAAIDNTTRKFLAEGRRTLTVGFWFALGHSSVVFLAALIIAAGFKAFAGQVESGESQLHVILGLVGALVSSLFLLLIGAINLLVLIHLVKVFRAMRKGTAREADLEDLVLQGGIFNRCLARLAALIRHPPQMYLLGFLFGLGFDTATEVALLFMAAGAASSGLPWFAILCLPVIFAAGMTLLDTIDGSFMNFAYSWAFSFPLRKLFFNIVITGLSVMVALLIGGIELLQLVIEKAGWEGQPWEFVTALDLNIIGFVIVGLFFLTWLASLVVWQLMRYDSSLPTDL